MCHSKKPKELGHKCKDLENDILLTITFPFNFGHFFYMHAVQLSRQTLAEILDSQSMGQGEVNRQPEVFLEGISLITLWRQVAFQFETWLLVQLGA